MINKILHIGTTRILITLVTLNELNISDIARKTELSLAHCLNLTKFLEKNKVVKIKINGRQKLISLTAKGRALSKLLLEITDICSRKKYVIKK